jgi:deoxyribodipyrimidine photo-lyase
MNTINIVWLRRDLRLFDNHALHEALKANISVLPIFIFDKNILDKLEKPYDNRVQFIHNTIKQLQLQLEVFGGSIHCWHSTPLEVFNTLIKTYNINAVYTNHDYETYGIERDDAINALLAKHNIAFNSFKDQVLFEKNEVVKDDGLPYTVFTPYSKKWKQKLGNTQFTNYDCSGIKNHCYQTKEKLIPTLVQMGFEETSFTYPNHEVALDIVKKYSTQRDYPGIRGTTQLGLHLRFGTISIRQLANIAIKNNETYLNELIWRDFYHMILYNFPHINKGKAFKPIYDNVQWNNNEAAFKAWCEGNTGYPIVDAGMRELNTTGFMHNRVRMITASFLTGVGEKLILQKNY